MAVGMVRSCQKPDREGGPRFASEPSLTVALLTLLLNSAY